MKIKIPTSLLAACLLLASHAGFSQFVDDVYWGGTPTSNANQYKADVIGETSVFGLTSSQVTYNSGTDSLLVEIRGNYFDDILYNRTNKLLGTSMGDLFISTNGLAWNSPFADTLGDYYGSGIETAWDYAVRLGTYDNSTGQLNPFKAGDNANDPMSATIHAITNPATQIELSHININGIYRSNQEVRIQNQGASIGGASWYFSDDASLLAIQIPAASSFLPTNGGAVGFHWTMTCGNDVIEFDYLFPAEVPPIPEPTTIGLIGLLGMAAYLRLRKRWR
jgi:hypothetical protein